MTDIEGKELEIGDKVIFTYADGNRLYLCEIERFTRKLIILKSLTNSWYMQCSSPKKSIYKINK